MTKDAAHRFLNKLEQMAEEPYLQRDSISHDDAWEERRSFICGYGDAGKTISLVTSEDIQQAIDRAHERVYGESWMKCAGFRLATGSTPNRDPSGFP